MIERWDIESFVAILDERARLRKKLSEIYDLAVMDIQTGSTSARVARIADLARKVGP